MSYGGDRTVPVALPTPLRDPGEQASSPPPLRRLFPSHRGLSVTDSQQGEISRALRAPRARHLSRKTRLAPSVTACGRRGPDEAVGGLRDTTGVPARATLAAAAVRPACPPRAAGLLPAVVGTFV